MACDLSVIIVTWNTKDFLCNCIRSIKENTKKIIYEIIVIDNFSSDGSPEMVEEKFPEIILIKNKINIGYGRASNQGLAAAQGKYVLILNSDIKINQNCLDDMLDFMEKNPAIGASSCKLTFSDGKLTTSKNSLYAAHILKQLLQWGAPEEICYDSKPQRSWL